MRGTIIEVLSAFDLATTPATACDDECLSEYISELESGGVQHQVSVRFIADRGCREAVAWHLARLHYSQLAVNSRLVEQRVPKLYPLAPAHFVCEA